MNIFRLSGFVVATAAFLLITPSSQKAGESPSGGMEDILKLHKAILASHLAYDAGAVLASESDQIIVVSRCEVQFRSKRERFDQFERYLKSVEFEEHRDLIDPIVRVSDDGTLGWLIARVKITGNRTGSDGEKTPFESTWAWIELYEKHDGLWTRVGEVSNVKP